MRTFTDETGASWIASAREEHTPRHHGRWYLIFEAGAAEPLAMPEVRWQTRATAERTLRTMSEFELRRRLHTVRERARHEPGATPGGGAPVDDFRRAVASAGES